MAGIGPPPKPAGMRQRGPKHATAAVLQMPAPDVQVPKLPPRPQSAPPWLPETLAWWEDVWRSELAPEYLQVDRHRLYVLAELMDAFRREPTTALAAEIRLQGAAFGMSSMDRRRLQWKKPGQEAPRRQSARGKPLRGRADPRRVLEAIK